MNTDRPTPHIRLLPAQESPSLAPLDESAQAVARAVREGEHIVVLGAAGTGKTNLALSLLAQAVARGEDAMLLAPTRARADALRARAAQILHGSGSGVVRVRTPASYAFSVVAASHAGRPDPLPAPVLLMGAAEDAALAQMLDPSQWEPLPPEAVTSVAMRTQLRNLLARCGELGISGEDLARLGQEYDVPIWQQAAGLVTLWDAQGRPHAPGRARVRKMDSVRIQDRAIEALRSWEEDKVAGKPPIPQLIIVDDYQDCTHATARMLTAFAQGCHRDYRTGIVVLGNPDVAVETFRGGNPSLLAQAQDASALAARRMELTRVYRGGPALHHIWSDQAQRIPVVASASFRLASGGMRDDEDASQVESNDKPQGVDIRIATSASQEAAHIARVLRAEHVYYGTGWDEMAVVVRSASQARVLARDLRRRGVPLAATTPAVLLRSEPAAAHILAVAEAALSGALGGKDHPADPAVIETLLTSLLVGLTSLDMRRVRRRLAMLAAVEGSNLPRGGQAALMALVADPDLARDFQRSLGQESLATTVQALVRAAMIVEAAQQVVASSQDGRVDCEQLLWSIWDASGCAERLREAALAPTSLTSHGQAMIAEAAEHNLDVVTVLFKRAEVWAERHPGAGAQEFLEEISQELLPSDSVAPQGQRPAGVEVLTPASCAGREWDVVVVGELFRDTWPDMRLRDSATKVGLLVDIASSQRVGSGANLDSRADQEAARAQVRADERRMFLCALSRARRRLVLTSVSDIDTAPSAFLYDAATSLGLTIADAQGKPICAPDVSDMTLRGMVGHLRHAAVSGFLPQATEQERQWADKASYLLAILAREGVPGAHPSSWQAVTKASSDKPLIADGEAVPIGPSDVEALIQCPLKWFFQRHGGAGASSQAQQLGTLIHELAQKAAESAWNGRDVVEQGEQLLPTLEYPGTTIGQMAMQHARELVARLAAYIDSVPCHVEAEIPIRTRIRMDAGADSSGEQALPPVSVDIRGRIDRLEFPDMPATADLSEDEAKKQRVRVVDLKTGERVYSDASSHPQLATYRLALENVGYQVDGAGLVLLGKAPLKRDGGVPGLTPGGGVLEERETDTPDTWDRRMLREAAHASRGPRFQAKIGSACRYCSFADSCPLQPQGRRAVA